MDLSKFLITLAAAFFIYYAGYPSIGILVFIGSFLVLIASNIPSRKPAPGGGANTRLMEPIIIESTRGAPYKIPEKMEIWMNADAKQSKPWWKKVTDKGPIAWGANTVGRVAGGHDVSEKKKD